MAWNPSDLKRYADEVKFHVGQFVEIDLEEVPVEERDCTWGLIVGIMTRFPLTPHVRQVVYCIKLAGCYIKKKKRMLGGLKGELRCDGKRLTLKEDHE